jgi:hypothetical protein
VLLDSATRTRSSVSSIVDSCFDAHSDSSFDTCNSESQVAHASQVKECVSASLLGTFDEMTQDLNNEKAIRKAMAPMIEVSGGLMLKERSETDIHACVHGSSESIR